MNTDFAELYLEDVRALFRRQKRLADRALAQIDETAFFALIDDEANSPAILVKHMAGNMRSRWQDFLTSDGEKPDRNRDDEFVINPGEDRAWLMARWEEGWAYLFDAIDPLSSDDLTSSVTIRGEPYSVVRAINRQLDHYSYHVGQIVLLCKHSAPEWQSLSIPKGQSRQFNEKMTERFAG